MPQHMPTKTHSASTAPVVRRLGRPPEGGASALEAALSCAENGSRDCCAATSGGMTASWYMMATAMTMDSRRITPN
jgi:hypothetical protein